MPTGAAGSAFMRNLPSGGYAQSDEAFDELTEKNVVPLTPIALTGLGAQPINVRLPNNGLLASVDFLFKGSLVAANGTGSVTAGYGWPHNLIKKLTLSANGQTSLKSVEGLDLRVKRQRVYRNPREMLMQAVNTDVDPAANANTRMAGAVGDPRPGVVTAGTYTLVLETNLPITHNERQMIGALFAQSDQNYLALTIQPATVGDLFLLTGTASATVTGTWYPTVTFFDIPIGPSNGNANNAGASVVIIPDLSYLHGLLCSDSPFANTGTVRAPFIRTDGELLTYSAYVDNGGNTQIAVYALNEVRMEYGGNRKPRVYSPTEHLLAKNQRDYNGVLAPNIIMFDYEVDNADRDRVLPKGVTELALAIEIPAGTTINPNARIHFVEETLFTGA